MEQLTKCEYYGSKKLSFSVMTTTLFIILALFSGLTRSAPGAIGAKNGVDGDGGEVEPTLTRQNSSRSVRSVTEGAEARSFGHKERHTKDTLVETTAGKLRGLRRNVFGKEVYAYLGVPFAKPPLGELRFKKPVEFPPWEGIRNAVTPPNSCIQETYENFPGFRGEIQWNPTTNISEDCLYLNLWAPKSAVKRPDKKLPILVWIYGGGYMSGTITLNIYNGDILAAENDAIVITLNYRVGAFGFLYLANDDAPGNQGMHDQVMALNWIQKNAHVFGGDPASVTMFGESAGGGSVTFHLLSPISSHLINRGIIQSGTMNAPWSVMEAAEAREMARELLISVECNGTKSDAEAVKCLKEKPASVISLGQWNSYKSILAFPSRPTIDGVFLPKHPMQLLKDGEFKRTEILIGSNKNEGTYFMLYDFLKYLDKDVQKCLSRETFLEIIQAIFPDRSTLEKEAILFQYTNWEDINDQCKNTDLIADVVGDYFFICPTNAFAQAYSDHGNHVYYYYFTQRTSSNPWGEWMGVLHADEIEYVFGHPLNNSGAHTVKEQGLSRKIMSYFTRFARTGRPVEEDVDWPLYTRAEPNYFILNAEGEGRGRGPRSHSCAFWNEFMPLIKPGTNSLPSECGKERWDITTTNSTAFSHRANKSLSIISILFNLVVLKFLYHLTESSFSNSIPFGSMRD